MSLESDVRLLRGVPLMASFPDDQLRLLAFSAENRRVAAGTRLFSAGDRADGGFVIADGVVALMSVRRGRADAAVARLGSGALIGTLSLVIDFEWPMTGVVVEDSGMIHIRRALFRRMLEEYPEAVLRVREHLAADLQQTAGELMRVDAALRALDGG